MSGQKQTLTATKPAVGLVAVKFGTASSSCI